MYNNNLSSVPLPYTSLVAVPPCKGIYVQLIIVDGIMLFLLITDNVVRVDNALVSDVLHFLMDFNTQQNVKGEHNALIWHTANAILLLVGAKVRVIWICPHYGCRKRAAELVRLLTWSRSSSLFRTKLPWCLIFLHCIYCMRWSKVL